MGQNTVRLAIPYTDRSCFYCRDFNVMYSSDVFSEELENQTQTDGQSFQIKSIALFKSKSWLTDISSEQLVGGRG